MTFVSKLALAAVLTLGTTALGAAPAAAQKKDDKKAEPQLQISPEFRKAAVAAETPVNAKDWAAAEPLIVAAEGLAKNDDEKYFAAGLRLKLELGRGNEAGMIAALQTLVNNPKTPKEALQPYTMNLNLLQGLAASKAKKHPETIQYLTKARELGSNNPDIPAALAVAYSSTGKQAEAAAELEKAIAVSKAAGRKPPTDWYRFIVSRANASGDRTAVASWLTRYIQDYPTVDNWRWAIQVFGLRSNGTDRAAKIEKIDRFRLMRATKSLADRSDYADYAYTAQSSGLPWEAISVIEEGRSSGKVPAADSDVNRTFAAAQAGVKSSPSLEVLAKQGAAAKDGPTAVQNADALLAAGDNARALALYDQAVAKGGIDANEVNLHRGVALQRLGRKDEAKAAFQQVTAGPLANLALLWQMSADLPPIS